MDNFEEKNNRFDIEPNEIADFAVEMSADDDMLIEDILDNIKNTPIGQVLGKIASMPEVRPEKVIGIRQQLCQDKYNVNDRLEAVLEKVLEQI
jgi:hypothetical protein